MGHDGGADERRQTGAIVGHDADDDGVGALGPDFGVGQIVTAPPGDFGVLGDVLAAQVLAVGRRHRVAEGPREFGRHIRHWAPPV